MSAMHKAARENAIEEMQQLIVTGKYDINEKDGMKRTPLHMAAWAGNVEIVKLLLRSKAKSDAIANDNFTALHFATNTEVIKQLVKSNKALLHARVSKGNKTALHIAVPKGDVEVVQCLIDLGSDISAKTSTGK
jgi:ankyrin repeat protein